MNYKVSPLDIAEYRQLLSYGFSQRQACLTLGIPRATMQDALRRLDEDEIDIPALEARAPKILFFDIENAPSVVVSFSRFNVNFGQDNVLEEGGWMLTACYKWAGESKIHKLCLTPEEALARDDSSIVAGLYEAFEEADLVVAQNGDRFDVPLLKTRGLVNGFPPFKTVRSIDTLKMARQLKFNSNRLDSLGAQLGLGRKVQHTGIDLWVRCMNGDADALREMLEYNEQDVVLLEAVYNKLRAYDTRHPNLGQYYSDNNSRCPACGSHNLTATGHSVFTPVSEFAEIVCEECGHRSRSRQAINTKEKRASLVMSAK